MMANRAILKSCLILFCLLVTVVFIAICCSLPEGRSPESRPPIESRPTEGRYPESRPPIESRPTEGRYPKSRPPIESPRPTAHLWQYLYSYGGEDSGYATYSYVLVGRDENNQTATSLYFELVKAIQGSTASAENLPDHVSNAHFNLFLIPATGNTSSESHEPNYKLSKLLLTALSTASPLKFSRPGPYIITLYQAISFEHDEIVDILYVDFTNIHPTAIPEVVRTYKSQILDKNLNGIEKLKSLRLSLLNTGLRIENSIGFAQAAYARLKSAFF